uniref:NADH dehydrogenase subunit 4 n=1 Tax=Uroconger lepturus TaxID=189925 RepID=UPI0028FC9E2F|nr:NADH dehydrogenase subunit 4 [Uroconger lepturus]WNH38064.1 NADH dehydrogenase subunit 4 [Uroconger lepturus]
MLKIIIPTLMLIPTTWLINKKWSWTAATCHSLMIATVSLSLLKWELETGWSTSNTYLAMDPLSTPLLILSCWLLPLMLMASQNHLSQEPINRQRLYITLLILLQILVNLTFASTETILFFIMFEATLIPTLIIITRWGNQLERLNAGKYFMFYTLAGSLPLLVAILALQKDAGTLYIPLLQNNIQNMPMSWGDKMWWTGCLLAFMVKMPLYGLHLWLPKAHVEAPIAGSMVLAAVLLKLGGYGMMRMMSMLSPMTKELAYPFIALALWGVIMTGSTCLRQTDLKAMIAYSSVSHMGLVAAGILIQTPWAFTGAIILMIAHGLVSSAMFCLANTNYERTHNRTLILTRGMQMILPLMGAWWFITNLANLALPPTPNLMGEIMIMISVFNWSHWSIIITGLGTLITASYSLYMFLMTQRGPTPNHITGIIPSHTREHLLISMHLIPMALLMLKPEIMWGWHM